VSAFLGIDGGAGDGDIAPTLEQGAVRVAMKLGASVPSLTAGLRDRAEEAAARLAPGRTAVRGYFSGGTLCYETQAVLERMLGPVRSNAPLRPGREPPAGPGEHLCLDLGEEEFTRGRPHPMIDPEARIEMLRSGARDPDVAVVLLDVVLGFGAHPDPATVLAPVCAELTAGDGPQVVAYVLGTDQDPQDYARQRMTLENAGCLTAPTAARAAHLAAAIAARDPDLTAAVP
jgi:FdrA protein